MNLAVISLVALRDRDHRQHASPALNVGVLALALAWIVGVYLGRHAAQRR